MPRKGLAVCITGAIIVLGCIYSRLRRIRYSNPNADSYGHPYAYSDFRAR